MSDDVQQVSPPGPEEAWERLTDDPDVRGIETARVDEIGGWQVTVWSMEFVRHDPLETDMRRRMATALRAVNGVATADEQDREVWFVTGTPSGKELTEAAARRQAIPAGIVQRMTCEVCSWARRRRPRAHGREGMVARIQSRCE